MPGHFPDDLLPDDMTGRIALTCTWDYETVTAYRQDGTAVARIPYDTPFNSRHHSTATTARTVADAVGGRLYSAATRNGYLYVVVSFRTVD